jgi:hypothetical protein
MAPSPLAVAYPFTAHIRMTQASRRRLTATDEANGKAKAKVPVKRLLAGDRRRAVRQVLDGD